MIVLSNCMTPVADEGCLNVANSLVKRMKSANPEIQVISYERQSDLTTQYIELNKLMLSKDLFRLLRKAGEDVLYIPFPAKPIATAIRICMLALSCPKKLRVLLTMSMPLKPLEKLLTKISGAEYMVVGADTYAEYARLLGSGKVSRLKVGVDTNKFSRVTETKSKELKKKYGFDPERPLVLHVGHLTAGRNVGQLLKISKEYQVLLVASTTTKNEQDPALREKLLAAGNIRIMDSYIPQIQEIYQMADVYFFPVRHNGHCIDSPLSCLEAAACGKPVVTTTYGEMNSFVGASGFYFLETFNKTHINEMIEKAIAFQDADPRAAVLEYDWNNAISKLIATGKEEKPC